MADDIVLEEGWTTAKVLKFFNRDPKNKQSLFNAEKKGEIPTSKRFERGNNKVRVWNTSQIPAIGEKFGFLKKLPTQKIITFFTSKGGVLKTTLAHEFARILALNGIKVIIVGLDIQCSITDILSQEIKTDTLEGILQPLGLYHFLFENAPLNEVIQKTDLPTLDFIPETPDLNALEKKLRDAKRREQVFKNKLIPNLSHYDIVIFDNSPSWNLLIENAISIANAVIAPIGCDINSWRSLQTNLNTFWEFYQEMNIELEHFFLVPTLLDTTKLSQQIYGAYLNQFGDYAVAFPIKRAIIGQEAIAHKKSVTEYAQTSQLATNYYALVIYIWSMLSVMDRQLDTVVLDNRYTYE
jgi:chromosome partitioning protein